jgi:hypothetical protein
MSLYNSEHPQSDEAYTTASTELVREIRDTDWSTGCKRDEQGFKSRQQKDNFVCVDVYVLMYLYTRTYVRRYVCMSECN